MTEKVILRNHGLVNPERMDDYIARKGFQSLEKVLKSLTPEKVIEEIERSGLRKREGRGLPVADELRMARETASPMKHVVCNATEWDPASSINSTIMENDPFSVIEGIIIAGYAMGACSGHVYSPGSNTPALARMRNAIRQAEEKSYLGERILGSDFSFTIEAVDGDEDFVCIEETALIAFLEGRKARSRIKPPMPAQSGIHNCPTVVNNVETFANIAPIMLNGPEWFGTMGTVRSRGTKVFQITSGEKNGKLIEMPMGTSLADLLQEHSARADLRSLKAVQLGGPLGYPLFQGQFDTTLDFESLEALGMVMGQGSVSLVETDADIAGMIRSFLEFTHKESCGKCVPCRIGSKRMTEILDRIAGGRTNPDDLESLRKIALAMKDSALCVLGQNIPNPVLAYIDHLQT